MAEFSCAEDQKWSLSVPTGGSKAGTTPRYTTCRIRKDAPSTCSCIHHFHLPNQYIACCMESLTNLIILPAHRSLHQQNHICIISCYYNNSEHHPAISQAVLATKYVRTIMVWANKSEFKRHNRNCSTVCGICNTPMCCIHIRTGLPVYRRTPPLNHLPLTIWFTTLKCVYSSKCTAVRCHSFCTQQNCQQCHGRYCHHEVKVGGNTT